MSSSPHPAHLSPLQMESLDLNLEPEFDEDDDLGIGYGSGLPGSSQSVPQSHQYSASSSSFAAPNAYYTPTTSYEVPTTSFYGQQQPATCTVQTPSSQLHHQGGGYITAIHHPNQAAQYLQYDPMQQVQQHHQVYLMQHSHGGQQVILQPVQPSVIVSQQQQYAFDHNTVPAITVTREEYQQLTQGHQLQPAAASSSHSSSDHSYASYQDAMGLYDDGSSSDAAAAPRNFSPPTERRAAPLLRDAPAKPVARMVQRKRAPIEMRVGETDSASAAAVRRISTEEGWKSMNGWLKAAEQDVNKLLQLLGQCREAKVTVTLLRSNDTPKFIRKLCKSHKDDEVRALSLSIVTKWKKVVNTVDVVEEKKEKERKDKKKEEREEEEEDEDESEEMKVVRPQPVDGRRSSDEGIGGEKKKKEEPKKDKEHRAKAKVYQSKGRSTGVCPGLDAQQLRSDDRIRIVAGRGWPRLEGDDGANPAKKRSMEGVPAGAPLAKKSSTEKAPAAGAASAAAPSSSALPPPPKKAVPAPVKKVTASSSFMASLMSPSAPAQPKKKVLPKRPIPRPEAKPARPTAVGGSGSPPPQEASRSVVDMLLSPGADGKVAMEGLFADTSRALKEERVPTPPKPVAAAAIFVSEEPDIAVGRRKIRFADEHGGELVETRFFEIEEGERINVNRYTPEEMKHYEALAENKWMKDNSGMRDDDEDDEDEAAVNPWLAQPQPPVVVSSHLWRFLPVEAEDRTEVACGSKSQMREIQEERQKVAMAAFYMPNERCSHFDEPENLYDDEPAAAAAGLRREPVMIPTESIEEPIEPEEATPAAAAAPAAYDSPAEPDPAAAGPPVIADRLKALIDGLKTQGLLHDGSNAAPIVDPYSVPPPGLQIPAPVQIPTTSTYYQEQSNGGGFGGGAPNRMHSIQQEFPGVVQQPPLQPPMGAAASSSGIQVVNMDVHGPGAPMPMQHGPPGGGDAPFPPYHPGPGRPFYVSNKPCTFFGTPRGCRFGDKCGFAHIQHDGQVMNNGPAGPFRGGPMRGGGRGEFRGGPPRGGQPFRGRGFGSPLRGSRDVDLRRGGGGGSWRDERRDDSRRERRRSRSRSPSPSRRDRDRDHRSSRREEREREKKDVDLRSNKDTATRPAPAIDDDDIDGIPIESPVA